ncbi:hypothetical protein P3S67_024863 [Capsicum chacoense]
MQHIPEAHVTCEIPVPPVYATEDLDFATSITFKVPYETDQYARLGKDVQSSEEGSIAAQLESLKRAFRNIQVTRGTESLDYDDLCINPNIDMPEGYKTPKFDVFYRKGDPHTYLRAYCDKLVGVERNEKLRMKLFIQSLSGEALTWYTRQDPHKWRDWWEMAEDFISRFRFNTEIAQTGFHWLIYRRSHPNHFKNMHSVGGPRLQGSSLHWIKVSSPNIIFEHKRVFNLTR